ncbi:hypothetical protein ABG768_012449 [Culter alburnus]|uniref:G-protein coupled receptors family 1 profile domain-containing protein n=1 Tax=Culter alburnus TaxID=194366 RepID=A0AAW2AZL3_CULAL
MEQNTSFNGSTGVNYDSERMRWEFYMKLVFAESLFVWIISVIEIPVMILTLVALCALIKSQRSAPVFVIHLILSDLIQIICMLMMTIKRTPALQELFNEIKLYIMVSAYFYSLIAGLYFMACVAFERYLLVSHPIWYKSHHSLKVSCVISVIIWFVPLIFADIYSDYLFNYLPRSIGCFIPYPIIILCFVGTRRGLSHAISLTSLKRQLILVLLTYTFLILPYLILDFIDKIFPNLWNSLLFVKMYYFFKYVLYLNPLADCLLYLFMRPDVETVEPRLPAVFQCKILRLVHRPPAVQFKQMK